MVETTATTNVTVDLDDFDITDLVQQVEESDYKVFSDDADGLSEAREWITDHDYIMFTDNEEAIEEIKGTEGVDFILDRLPTDAMVTYNVLHNPIELVAGLQENRQYIVAQDKESLINYVKNDISSVLNPFDVYTSRDIIDEMNSSDYVRCEFIQTMLTHMSPDEIMGPIESTDIINHLENSIDAMVIRKAEMPTDELCEVFLSYMDDFDYRTTFIKLMRRHGVMLETILRAYIEDERNEEREHNGF